VDLNQFYNQHYEHNADFSIAVRKVKNAGRYGSIELVPYFLSSSSTKTTDNFFKVNSFNEKNENTNEGIINGGIYILNNKQFFKYTNANDAFSIEKNFFETQCLKIDMGAFLSNGYFIDIGIPEDYQKAQDDFKNFKYK
jgi:D-glycero-alpha-D-manno-heptose 1-phosphate guanylyltransferase